MSITGAVTNIPVHLGRSQYNEEVSFDLAGDAAHMVVQGKTRSGKSVAMYSILAQCAVNPAVRVVGSDPTAILLAPFRYREVSESKVVLGFNPQATLDMLLWVKAEMDRRIEHMLPLRIAKYEAFSAAFPLIVVVLEEYAGIIEQAADDDAMQGRKPAERLAPRIKSMANQIAAQSAKAGIRLVIITQRAEAAVLGGLMRSNAGTKLTLRVDEPESVRMLHPSATPEDCGAVENFAPGVGLFDSPGRPRQMIRCDHVEDYRLYSNAVEFSDLRFLYFLALDRAQQELLASEYPDVLDLE